MSSNQLEIILSRQLADSLSIPIFIVDPKGNLLFYNEPAEGLLGKRFEETGALPVEEWSTMFQPTYIDGTPIPPDQLPLVKTLKNHHPNHGTFYIKSLKDEINKISVTAYPIIGRPDRFLGAMSIFWKNEEE